MYIAPYNLEKPDTLNHEAHIHQGDNKLPGARPLRPIWQQQVISFFSTESLIDTLSFKLQLTTLFHSDCSSPCCLTNTFAYPHACTCPCPCFPRIKWSTAISCSCANEQLAYEQCSQDHKDARGSFAERMAKAHMVCQFQAASILYTTPLKKQPTNSPQRTASPLSCHGYQQKKTPNLPKFFLLLYIFFLLHVPSILVPVHATIDSLRSLVTSSVAPQSVQLSVESIHASSLVLSQLVTSQP